MKLKLARTNIVMTLCFWVTERQVSVKTRRTSDAEARSVCPLDCPHQSPSSPTISPLWSSYKFVLHLFIYMRFFFSSLFFLGVLSSSSQHPFTGPATSCHFHSNANNLPTKKKKCRKSLCSLAWKMTLFQHGVAAALMWL